MNRTNRTSVIRRSGVKAGVRALPNHRAPYIRGGMGHKSAGGCSTAIFLTLLYHCCLPTTTRPDRADTEEKGRTEATPPFLPLVRQSGLGFGAGGVTGFGAHPTPLWGSLPSKLSLREGSEPAMKPAPAQRSRGTASADQSSSTGRAGTLRTVPSTSDLRRVARPNCDPTRRPRTPGLRVDRSPTCL